MYIERKRFAKFSGGSQRYQLVQNKNNNSLENHWDYKATREFEEQVSRTYYPESTSITSRSTSSLRNRLVTSGIVL